MTAHTSAAPTFSAAMASRLSSSPSPRTSPSPHPTSFIQEIDVFMENIGRLVKALEDQHKQRRFDIARPSLDGGDTVKSTDTRQNPLGPRDPSRVLDRSLSKNKVMSQPDDPPSTQ
ncbi:hypothetical protein B0H12DRAFT_340706 [Mycena haematopus]|nr:hypothetical protein B0H12DRAFT_340706 [Mycena haematopus]